MRKKKLHEQVSDMVKGVVDAESMDAPMSSQEARDQAAKVCYNINYVITCSINLCLRHTNLEKKIPQILTKLTQKKRGKEEQKVQMF